MPIRFSCPHCGNTKDVAEQYAGQSGPCAQCGRTITVPALGTAPLYYDQYPAKPPRSTGSPVLLILAVVLGVILACGGVLVAVLYPAFYSARDGERRAGCSQNLHQIGMAMHLYHNKYGHFPPAHSVDKKGKPLLSWRVLILPFLEEQSLYNQFRLDEPWNSPHNLPLAKRMPDVYRCPAEANVANNATSYAMLVGPSAISTGPEGRKIADIPDGVSNTIMVAETTDSNIRWTEPRDLDAELMTFDLADQSGTEISSRHSTTVNVLFANGSVNGLSKSTDADSVKSMTTIDGGEQIRPEDDADIPEELD